MMRMARLTLAATALALGACSTKGKGDTKADLSKDTALAADLRAAGDTAALNEAADVSMRDIPDSTLPMPPQRPMREHPATAPTMRTGDTRTPPRLQPSKPHPTPMPVTPPDVRPSPGEQPRVVETVPPASTPSASEYPTPACASPAMADQRRCLLAYLARSDATLNRTYQTQIQRLRSEAAVAPGAPDPESVQRLRTAQRAWLVYRDTECRNRNRGQEGALWAPVRASCLAEFSQARAAELAR